MTPVPCVFRDEKRLLHCTTLFDNYRRSLNLEVKLIRVRFVAFRERNVVGLLIDLNSRWKMETLEGVEVGLRSDQQMVEDVEGRVRTKLGGMVWDMLEWKPYK